MRAKSAANPVWLSLSGGLFSLALGFMDWHNNYVAAAFVIATLFCLWMAFKDWLRFPGQLRFRWDTLKALTFDSKMPLDQAARLMYEAARSSGSHWAALAEQVSGAKMTPGSPSEILDFLAMYIAGAAQIYGERAPSTDEEPIAQAVRGKFTDGAKELHFRDTGETYRNLRVAKQDLGPAIEAIKCGLKDG